MRGFNQKRVTACLMLVLASGSAFADVRCDEIEQVDALNECLANELGVADKRLNAAYAELRRALPAERRELLRKAQASWVSLRDKDCEFEASAALGGTGYQSLNLSCLIDATKSRTSLLQNWRKPAR